MTNTKMLTASARRLEQKQANQAEIKEGFSFLNKETYEALLLTRWLDKSGHPIPEHPELSVEKEAETKIFSKKDPVPLDLLLVQKGPKGTLMYEHKQPLVAG